MTTRSDRRRASLTAVSVVACGLLLACVTPVAASAQTAPPGTKPGTPAPAVPTVPPTSVPIATTPPPTVGPTFPSSPSTSAPGQAPGATSTLPGGTTTTTVLGGPKPGTDPAGDPAAAGDAPPDEVPQVDLTVPPRRDGSPILTGNLPGAKVVIGEFKTARAELLLARKERDSAAKRVESIEAEMAAAAKRVGRLKSDRLALVVRFAAMKKEMADRTADAYIGAIDGADAASSLIASKDSNEYGRRRQYVASVLNDLHTSVERVRVAQNDLDPTLLATGQRQAELLLEYAAAKAALEQTSVRLLTAGFAVSVFAAGSQIFVNGFVFPVADPHNFVDSFGAPREVGNADFHYHEGTDIMAAGGTPLFACERGVISKISNSKLGGTSLWIKGESNTSYYYAHLSAYESGIAVGTVVEAGARVGYVGSTGNAQGSAPHLHFEIHPNGGPAINPYPLLQVIDDTGHSRPVATTTEPR